jgi:drug/metabolite transporter (DMT)-like permease
MQTLSPPGRLHPAVYALGAAVLFGASTPFAKLLLADLAPLPLATLLYLGSGLGILPFLLLRGRPAEERNLRRADLTFLMGAVAAGGILAPAVLLYGLDQTPASTASLLLNMEVVATALFALLLFREEITRRVWAAILVLVLASVLLFWNGEAPGFSLGALGVVASTLLWGLDNNLTCVISGKDAITIAVLKGLGGGLALGMITLAFSVPWPAPPLILRALLLGFFSYGLSTILFVLSLRNLGSTRTSSYFTVAPFVGAMISLIVFRQVPGVLFLAALFLMLGGVSLLAREARTRIPTHLCRPPGRRQEDTHP